MAIYGEAYKFEALHGMSHGDAATPLSGLAIPVDSKTRHPWAPRTSNHLSGCSVADNRYSLSLIITQFSPPESAILLNVSNKE